MAYGAKKIYPIDNRPGVAIGISIPFNNTSVFNQTYVTKDALKNNLINFFLTNQNERYLNNEFGSNIRNFIFEQINSNNEENLKENLQSQISRNFPNIKLDNLSINLLPDNNEIQIIFNYSIINTGINDEIEILI